MTKNEYVPFLSKVLEVIPHTAIEYTFRMSYEGDVLPGQFFEVSIPKFGEAPISVSGIGDGSLMKFLNIMSVIRFLCVVLMAMALMSIITKAKMSSSWPAGRGYRPYAVS